MSFTFDFYRTWLAFGTLVYVNKCEPLVYIYRLFLHCGWEWVYVNLPTLERPSMLDLQPEPWRALMCFSWPPATLPAQSSSPGHSCTRPPPRCHSLQDTNRWLLVSHILLLRGNNRNVCLCMTVIETVNRTERQIAPNTCPRDRFGTQS